MHARMNASLMSASVLGAVAALVLAAGGVGYAAGRIGTADIKDGAITAPKIRTNAVSGRHIRDGSLTVADVAAEERYRYVGAKGQPRFAEFGPENCTWRPGGEIVPGVSGPAFRKDRFGVVHLTGIAVRDDRAICEDPAPGDVVVFRLPPAYRPAATQLLDTDLSAGVIVGPAGLEVAPDVVLEPGTVALPPSEASLLVLDGVTFEPEGSPLVR